MATIPEALQIALAHHQAGRLAEAEPIYRQILAADPHHADAWHFLGVLAHQAGQSQNAIEYIGKAIEIMLQAIAQLDIVRNKYLDAERTEAAHACQQQLFVYQTNLADAYNNRGLAYNEMSLLHEAVDCYHLAITIRPDLSAAHNNLGNSLYNQGRFEDSLLSCQQALHFSPHDHTIYNNLANALRELGRLNEAKENYEYASKLKPDYASARYNLAVLQLLAGDMKQGWSEYEWRWQVKNSAGYFPRYAKPVWNGEPLEQKTLLLCAEQGLGDTFQFIRYTKELKRFGANILLTCPSSLIRLLSRCENIDFIVPKNAAIPAFDYHLPLLSLPRVFKTELNTIPADVPYLQADPDLVKQWHTQLTQIHGFRIGINWRGREGNGPWLLRNIPLELFSSIANTDNVQLISLQKGPIMAGERTILNKLNIVDYSNDLDTTSGPFMDTAAIMKNLDLVITSDTSIVHLAGALGVPVWVALPFVPDWRWLLDRDDSPWYPTMRLFRQSKRGEWADVFDRMAVALREF